MAINSLASINLQQVCDVRPGQWLRCLLGRAAASKVNIQQKTALFQWKLEGPGRFFLGNLESLSIFKERKAVFSLLNSLLCVNPYLDCSCWPLSRLG